MERVIHEVRRGERAATDLAYWLSRPMSERSAAVEVLRQQAFGVRDGADAEQRLQRIYSVSQRPRR